jgi:glycosyltransferase involved in cell wall biosynthesis
VRICIVAPTFPPSIGGPATHLAWLAAALTEHGHSVTVFAFANPAAGPLLQSTAYELVYVSGVRRLLRALNLLRLLFRRAAEFDVIYSHGRAFESAIVARLGIGRRHVVKITGDFAWERSFSGLWTKRLLDEFEEERAWRARALRLVRNWYVRSFDSVLVPSQYLKRIVQKWGVASESISVVYNVVCAPPESEHSPRVDGTETFRLVTVARLVPWKGLHELFEVVAKQNNVGLQVIGDGPELEMLVRHSQQLKIDERVQFMGSVGHDTVFAFLREADAFVLNSLYEGFAHVIPEAMLAGTPVIATAVGGTPELVEDGVTGLLVPPASPEALAAAIGRVRDDKVLREELSRCAREKVERELSVEVAIQGTIETLQRR